MAGEKQKIQPGITALLRRIGKGQADGVPFISTLVCIANFVGVEHLFPTGVFDLAAVKGSIVLGRAKGGEVWTPIAGKSPAPQVAAEGEVLLRDDASGVVICKTWNSKGGKDTAMSADSTDIVMDIDCILAEGDTTEGDLTAAASLAAQCFREFCGVKEVSAYLLSPEAPSFTFGSKSTLKLAKPSKTVAKVADSWLTPTPIDVAMSVDALTASLLTKIVEVSAQSAGDPDTVKSMLTAVLKRELNMLQNHAYAAGLSARDDCDDSVH